MATEAAARAFFSAPHFAVVGASSDPSKFGHKSKINSPTACEAIREILTLGAADLRYMLIPLF